MVHTQEHIDKIPPRLARGTARTPHNSSTEHNHITLDTRIPSQLPNKNTVLAPYDTVLPFVYLPIVQTCGKNEGIVAPSVHTQYQYYYGRAQKFREVHKNQRRVCSEAKLTAQYLVLDLHTKKQQQICNHFFRLTPLSPSPPDISILDT